MSDKRLTFRGAQEQAHNISPLKRAPHSSLLRTTFRGENGRGRGIRTPGPLLPKQVLYQAELCPDNVEDALISGVFQSLRQVLNRAQPTRLNVCALRGARPWQPPSDCLMVLAAFRPPTPSPRRSWTRRSARRRRNRGSPPGATRSERRPSTHPTRRRRCVRAPSARPPERSCSPTKR